jgi:hypothetical protein
MLINFIPYLRNKISILLAVSAILLLTTSPLLLFNLLQPIQAQSARPTSFRTPTPANGNDDCAGGDAAITFEAYGTPSSSNPNAVLITNGTWTVTDPWGVAYSGHIDTSPNDPSSFSNYTVDGFHMQSIVIHGIMDSSTRNCPVGPDTLFEIQTLCSTSNGGGALNPTVIDTYYTNDWHTQPKLVHIGRATGVVECSSYQGEGGTTTQSSSMSGSSQDRDGDGVPDAKDYCPNIPNKKCYIEGNTTPE